MNRSARVLAVDLGATSIRVADIDLATEIPQVKVLHRWHHQPLIHNDGSLRWDWDGIVTEVEKGLERGVETGPVASIGIDGWGVDYGLIDGEGLLVAPPYSYRDSRTGVWRTIAGRIGADRLYQITGIQLMGINTIFQLAIHDQTELKAAARILLLPDLVVHHLGGGEGAERSNVSTTGLMDVNTRDWSDELIDEISIDPILFPDVKPAGTPAGKWRGVPIHRVGSHDTASAFLGMPSRSGSETVFVSAGSWVIVGVERPRPDISSAALDANFSNEAGALGGVRFLKNVVGLWILEQCRPGWGEPPIETLIGEASEVTEPVPRFNARDLRFLNPVDMEEEIRAACDLPEGAPRGVIVRVVLESIVDGITQVISEIRKITGLNPTRLAVVGGGARLLLFHKLLAARTGLDVVRGSSEATALGNALVQGLAIGRFADAAEARGWVERTGER